MIYSLDTSTAVDLLRGEPGPVRERFAAARTRGDELMLSAVALYELAYGAHHSAKPQAHLADLDRLLGYVEVVAFEGEDAMTAGRLRHELQPHGHRLGTPDLLIGAQALGRGWAVVTSNVRHFARLPGLRVVDWRRSDEALSAADIISRLTGRTED